VVPAPAPTSARPPAATALAAFRIGFGVASALIPGPTWQLAGIDPTGNPDAPLLARFFASREVAIGAGLALGADARERRRWLTLGLAVDAADGLSAVLAGRRGRLTRPRVALDLGGSLLALALGAVALRSEQRR
jgi:hypothetical protein